MPNRNLLNCNEAITATVPPIIPKVALIMNRQITYANQEESTELNDSVKKPSKNKYKPEEAPT